MTKCKTCHGYGLWTVGMPLPMEKEHFNEGMPNKPCPECGSGKREVKERTDTELTYELVEEIMSEIRCCNIPLERKVEALCAAILRTVGDV